MKKILYVHYGDDWLRGSERCVLDLMEHLNQNHYLPILWCNSDVMVEEARALGITTEQDDFKQCTLTDSLWHKLYFIQALVRKAISIIDDYGVDLIHVNSVAPCQWMTIAARLRNVPIIGHYHTQYQTRERYLSLSHWVDRIIGVSQDVIKPYKQDVLSQGKSEVIYNGINQNAFVSQKPHDLQVMFDIKPTDFALLSVGSLIPRKGYDDLIRSISLLHKRGHKIKCVIVGGGPEENNLKQLVKQQGLEKYVHLVGQRYDVGRFYKSAFKAFISTSRNEAFGLVNVEAAFCGKAIIAPDVNGLNEIFTPSVDAELFFSNAPEVISDAIERLILSPEYLSLLQKHGKTLAYSHFTIERYVNEFERLYEEELHTNRVNEPQFYSFCIAIYKEWFQRSRLAGLSTWLTKLGDV